MFDKSETTANFLIRTSLEKNLLVISFLLRVVVVNPEYGLSGS